MSSPAGPGLLLLGYSKLFRPADPPERPEDAYCRAELGGDDLLDRVELERERRG
jgi:hypothetical protein